MSYDIVKRFFLDTASSYDRIVAITTFNRDKAWKRMMISLLPRVDYCLDLACGTGILTSMLRSKAKHIIGVDMIHPSVVIAKSKSNEVIEGVAEYLPFKDDSIDAIVSSYLPKYCDARLTMRESARILKDGGVIIMHDFIYPSGLIRMLWHVYFLILKCIGAFSRWRIVLNELDKVIMKSNWVEDLKREMEHNGFVDIRYMELTLGTSALLYAKKGSHLFHAYNLETLK